MSEVLSKKEKKQKKLEKLKSKLEKMKCVENKPKVIKKKDNFYNSAEIEEYVSNFYKKNKIFENLDYNENNSEKFSIVLPPPNITGKLHIGHSMMLAIEDSLVRFNRLKGKETLFLPGLDHAGIATQNVIMKQLERENKKGSSLEEDKKLSQEISRESFMEYAKIWYEKYGNTIIEQFNKLGASLDYSKKIFTLDKKVKKSVLLAFKKLYKKKLIYKKNTIINYSSKLKTTISDLEVNYKEIKGNTKIKVDNKEYEFGKMYYVKYFLIKEEDKEKIELKIKNELEKKSQENFFNIYKNLENKIFKDLPSVIIGTTRPETILGDSGICINPEDERFLNIKEIFENKKIIGEKNSEQKKVENNVENTSKTKNKYKMNDLIKNSVFENLPLLAINPLTFELMPVIRDFNADLKLGTGVLKITPCHDFIDFKIGKKHNLKRIKILDDDNFTIISENLIHLNFLNKIKRFEARNIIKDLPFIFKSESYDIVLPFCSRSNDIIEPCLKKQWFIKCKKMAKKSIELVKNNEIEIYPKSAKKVYFKWLKNIKDWCISRQLYWGHQLPVYYYKKNNKNKIFVGSEKKALKIEKEKNIKLTRDPDVLDTWFSSGLWPFCTLGWGWDSTVTKYCENNFEEKNEKSPQLEIFKRFFPNSILETGSDILFFWVCRMIMLSTELLNKKPFNKVLLHGIVRDAHGRKMSKSLGNVIDPLFVINGATKENLIENISINVDKEEFNKAKKSISKDFPNGIPRCGADALRFTLLSYTNKMKDINLDILRVHGSTRLCNKIFNSFKYVNIAIKNSKKCEGSNPINCIFLDKNFNYENIKEFILNNSNLLKSHHKWILLSLNTTIRRVNRYFENFNFMFLSQSIHSLFLYEFCDIYIEFTKNSKDVFDTLILYYVFLSIINLFNPLMPFITDFINLKYEKELIKKLPEVLELELENDFIDEIKALKIIRKYEKVKVNKELKIFKLLKNKEIIIEEINDYDEKIGDIKIKFK